MIVCLRVVSATPVTAPITVPTQTLQSIHKQNLYKAKEKTREMHFMAYFATENTTEKSAENASNLKCVKLKDLKLKKD